jgi:hypothetical protein
VERGYLKGASIGFSFDSNKMEKAPDGVWELAESELFEASICAIPSNKNALRLYAADTGKLLTEQEVYGRLSALSNQFFKPKNSDMKKIALTRAALTALGFSSEIDESQTGRLSEAIEGLKAQLDAKEAALKAATDALQKLQAEAEVKARAEAEKAVQSAIAEGRLDATAQAEWVKLMLTDLEMAKKTLAAIPARKTLAGQVNNPGAPADIKTLDDFQKLPMEQQLAFKAEKPQEYQTLLNS